MSAKWGYEALAVIQYRDNKYKHIFYGIEKKQALAVYVKDFWSQELLNTIYNVKSALTRNTKPDPGDVQLLKNELFAQYQWNSLIKKTFTRDQITVNSITPQVLDRIKSYVNKIQNYYATQITQP